MTPAIEEIPPSPPLAKGGRGLPAPSEARQAGGIVQEIYTLLLDWRPSPYSFESVRQDNLGIIIWLDTGVCAAFLPAECQKLL